MCIYIYIGAYTYISLYIYRYVCAHISIHIHKVHTRIYTLLCVYVFACVCGSVWCACVYFRSFARSPILLPLSSNLKART